MRVLLLFVCVWSVPASAFSQAWTRDSGSVYVQVSHRFIRADAFYAPNGDSVTLAQGDYVQHVLGFYAEVGVVDRWLTLSADGELFRRNVLKNQGAVTGMGDLRFGAWTGLVVSPFRLALGVLVGAPTGDPSPSAGSGATPEQEAIARSLPTGDGEVDTQFHLAIGHGFGGGRWPLQHYVLGDFAYALRTEGLTDQFVYRGELGTRIDRKGWDRLLLILRLSGTELLGDASFAGRSFSGLGEFTVTAYGLELVARVYQTLSLSFGVDGAFRGESVPSAAQFKSAISWEH